MIHSVGEEMYFYIIKDDSIDDHTHGISPDEVIALYPGDPVVVCCHSPQSVDP
jgi:hypothetical protein